MATLLKIIGGGWAAFGAYYFYHVASTPGIPDQALGFAIIIAMVVFVLPGLMVAGIGSMVGRLD